MLTSGRAARLLSVSKRVLVCICELVCKHGSWAHLSVCAASVCACACVCAGPVGAWTPTGEPGSLGLLVSSPHQETPAVCTIGQFPFHTYGGPKGT